MVRAWIFAGLLSTAVPGAPSVINGPGRAIDGDSLMVGTQEVRLYGIDAPEFTQSCTRSGQPWACGKAAADELTKLLSAGSIACTATGVDRHGRTLARCRVGQVDLNRTMVATGFALAYRRYSMDYVAAEDSAKLARRGIWASTFERPDEVRHAGEDYVVAQPTHSGPQPIVSNLGSASKSARSDGPPHGSCRIKGNQSRRGDRIYHLPGMPYYEQTRAEQMFCTEAEARAAGFRRSRADQRR